METTEIIKANFEKFKIEKGLTINQIAKDKGVTRQTIYSYFREGITLRTIEKIAQLVGVQPWQLLQPNTPTTNPFILCPYCKKPIYLTTHTHNEIIK